jgi:hypothetical protein
VLDPEVAEAEPGLDPVAVEAAVGLLLRVLPVVRHLQQLEIYQDQAAELLYPGAVPEPVLDLEPVRLPSSRGTRSPVH